MTAFSRCEKSFDKFKLYIEIKTLNNRYLDVRINQPQVYNPFHSRITKLISNSFSRGGFDIFIKREVLTHDYLNINFNSAQADKVVEILKIIKNKYSLEGEISISDLTPFDIISNKNMLSDDDLENEWAKLELTLKEALQKIDQMRITEGNALWKDISQRLSLIEMALSKIESGYVHAVNDYSTRVLERINKTAKKISKDLAVDIEDPRFQVELGYIIERCDITEELIRLKSHIQEFKKLEFDKDSVGRKMDFLLQEMNRESNTIASKNIDKTTSIISVEMRAEIEKIRQQVQNIE